MLASSLLPARCHTYAILSYQGSTIISCLQLIPQQPRAGWHQKLNLCLQALPFFSWPWLFLGIGCFVSRYFSFGICHLMLWLWPHPELFLSPRHWWASGNSLEFLNRHHKLHEDKLVFALETTQNHKPLSNRPMTFARIQVSQPFPFSCDKQVWGPSKPHWCSVHTPKSSPKISQQVLSRAKL